MDGEHDQMSIPVLAEGYLIPKLLQHLVIRLKSTNNSISDLRKSLQGLNLSQDAFKKRKLQLKICDILFSLDMPKFEIDYNIRWATKIAANQKKTKFRIITYASNLKMFMDLLSDSLKACRSDIHGKDVESRISLISFEDWKQDMRLKGVTMGSLGSLGNMINDEEEESMWKDMPSGLEDQSI